jgi:type II secretory pathway predicted ATPase ExeA
MSEDMSKQLLQELGNNELQKYCTTFSDDSTNLTEEQIIQDITQQLTQKTKTRIHKHATFILSNLGPAKKLVEKERIYYVQ